MRRVRWLLAIALCVPQTSFALQLRWSTGSTDLTVSQNTQAVLVVQADSSELALPNSWRLQWTADSLGVQLSPFEQACLVDTAKVDSIAPPYTPADSAANQITAYFCSAGSTNAATAYFLADLPAGGHGKMKVVALNPMDTTEVIESNEVTSNGGIGGDYAPLVLSASSVHRSLQVSVSVVGANLTGASSLSIAASNGSWSLPLTITAHGDSSMTGVASVAALLPACQAIAGVSGGHTSSASLVADPEIEPDIPESGGCVAQYAEELLLSPPSPLGYEVQPKDFSFTPGFVDPSTNQYALHLFYIRHNYWYYQPPNNPSLWHPELDEKNLGHAWTSDFVSWHGPAAGDKTDTTGIKARPGSGKFDELHVWAPTIVHPPGPTFFMFYTGVRNEGGKENQRIGVATSTDLNTWTQSDAPVLSSEQIPWVNKNPANNYGGSQQLRDPYVMEYPIGSGRYIMFFVGIADSSGLAEDMAVGAATSTDLVTWTPLRKPIAATKLSTSQGHTHIVESPHVFKRNGQWWMPYTVGGDQVFFETTTSADPSDTLAVWSSPVWLRDVSDGEPAEMQYWHATEHLGSGSTEWLAAFNDNEIGIQFKGVYPTEHAGVDSVKLWCPSEPPPAGVGDSSGSPSQLQLVALRRHLGSPDVGLRMELPWRTAVRLAVYDVAGRRLTTLVDRELPAGVTDVKWSGTSDGGGHVPSGIYFVRFSCARGVRASKVIMLR